MIKFYFVLISVAISADAQLSLSSEPCRTTWTDIRFGRIVGGSDAAHGSTPYIASLTRRGGHFCGATIVNEQWLLTAAHCVCTGFDEIMPARRIRAVLGLHAISDHKNTVTESVNHEQPYEIELRSIVVHPNYDCKRPDNDIALLEISRPITFSRTVQPMCIASASDGNDNETYDNVSAVISGWGNLAEQFDIGKRPDVLQNAEVQIWSNRDCQASFDKQNKVQTIRPTQLCAGKRTGGVDACWADSGGPMIAKDIGLVGIVSTGIGCARPGLPGIYTRVSEYTHWIKRIVSEK